MFEIGIMNRTNISKLSELLEKEKSVEFKYNNLFYEIFESCDTGYIVNLYSSDEKDKDDEYLEENLVDGGLCSGSASDTVWFMV